jgi:hypothetical protein
MVQTDPSSDSFMSYCHYVICFCKAAKARKVAPTICSPFVSIKVQDRYRALPGTLSMPRAVKFGGPDGSGLSDATMNQVSASDPGNAA